MSWCGKVGKVTDDVSVICHAEAAWLSHSLCRIIIFDMYACNAVLTSKEAVGARDMEESFCGGLAYDSMRHDTG